jgi:putative peptidoglycan lipid II flippase
MSTARSLLTVNAIVLATILIGMANNILIANFFGLTRLLDSYYAALMIPEMCASLFLDFLGRNFLPAYAAVRQSDPERAAKLASAVITIVGLCAVAVVVVLMLLARPAFGALLPGFAPAELNDVVKIFYIVSPALVLMAVSTFNEYVYQYKEQYLRMALYRAAVPATILVTVVLGENALGEYSLPIGFLSGHVLMFVLLTASAGYRYRPRLTFEADYLRRIFLNSGLLIAAGFVGRTRGLVTQYFASLLGAGSLAALTLAHKITLPLHQSSLVAMRIMVFSKSVKLFVSDEQDRLGELYRLMITFVLLVLTPVAAWVLLESSSIVELLFLRGEFTVDMSELVVLATAGIALSIPFAGANETLSNAFYATNRSAVIAAVIPLSTLVYLAGAAFAATRFGILGLALSEVLVEIFVFVFLVLAFAGQNRQFSRSHVAIKLLKYGVVAAGTMYLGVSAVGSRLDEPLLRLPTSLALGGTLYVGTLLLLRDGELKSLLERLRDAVRFRAQPARESAG